MTEELSNSIRSAIDQNLPAMVAKELKAFIENAEKVTRDHQALKAVMEIQVNELTSLREQKHIVSKQLLEVDVLKKELQADRETLKVKMINIDLLLNQIKLEQMELRLKDAKEFMLMLAKNPRAIEYMNTSINESIPVRDNNGYYSSQSKSGSHITTVEKSETKE